LSGVHTPLNLNLNANNVECCKILTQSGYNISVALREDIEDDIQDGKLCIIPFPEDIWIKIDAIVHRGTLFSPLIQTFIDYAKACF